MIVFTAFKPFRTLTFSLQITPALRINHHNYKEAIQQKLRLSTIICALHKVLTHVGFAPTKLSVEENTVAATALSVPSCIKLYWLFIQARYLFCTTKIIV